MTISNNMSNILKDFANAIELLDSTYITFDTKPFFCKDLRREVILTPLDVKKIYNELVEKLKTTDSYINFITNNLSEVEVKFEGEPVSVIGLGRKHFSKKNGMQCPFYGSQCNISNKPIFCRTYPLNRITDKETNKSITFVDKRVASICSNDIDGAKCIKDILTPETLELEQDYNSFINLIKDISESEEYRKAFNYAINTQDPSIVGRLATYISLSLYLFDDDYVYNFNQKYDEIILGLDTYIDQVVNK